MTIKCIAFDCFGTVFDMTYVSRDEIREYVNHVRRNDFSPFEFPESWWKLRAHQDARKGIFSLHEAGFYCVALSNGSWGLIRHISERNGIAWDYIIDLAYHKVYKPHVDAYKTIQKDLGFAPHETLLVTANPTFGDIEGAAAVGMRSQVIRHEGTPATIIELCDQLTRGGRTEAMEVDHETNRPDDRR